MFIYMNKIMHRLHDASAVDANKRFVITNPPGELRLLSSDMVTHFSSLNNNKTAQVYVLEQFDPGLEYEPAKMMRELGS